MSEKTSQHFTSVPLKEHPKEAEARPPEEVERMRRAFEEKLAGDLGIQIAQRFWFERSKEIGF